MKAMTVLGAIDVEALGIVLMHEHLLHDDVPEPFWFHPFPGEEGINLADAPITMDTLGFLRRAPYVMRENIRLTRRDPIIDELQRFKTAGGGTVVELTNQGLTPDPDGLRAISHQSGVHVVAGCGYYVHGSHPSHVESATVEELASGIIQDLRVGIGGTSVRAGIIGEMGLSETMTREEEKCLRAAGMASAETGAAVMIHVHMTGQQAFPAFDVLTAEGVAPERIVMNHIDEANDLDYALRLVELGCIVEYDTFGHEEYLDFVSWGIPCEPRDTERVDGVASLCRAGYATQITISQDVFWKSRLRAYGGFGYDHILVTVVPMLRAAGVNEEQIRTMLVETPRRLLGIAELDAE